VKFKDADLTGIPYRINVGKKLPLGLVEVVDRRTRQVSKCRLPKRRPGLQTRFARPKRTHAHDGAAAELEAVREEFPSLAVGPTSTPQPSANSRRADEAIARHLANRRENACSDFLSWFADHDNARPAGSIHLRDPG